MYQLLGDFSNWLTQFFQLGRVGEILKTYQAIFAALFAVIVWPAVKSTFWFLKTTLRRHWDVRAHRFRHGSDLVTRNDILTATKFFLEPDCQSVDPSGGEDFRKVFSTREPAFKALDKLLSTERNEKYTIILGDTGMGKTTLLINYYARHYRRSRLPFRMAIVPLGRKEADSVIESLKDRSETVLLLDALDEDTLAIQDHKNRLSSLLDRTKGFRHVLITCRTQFFERDDEIPRETGLLRLGVTSAGQSKGYTFSKLYLSTFSDDQIESYLKRRFPIWRFRRRRKAFSIASRIPDLTVRPMLIANIESVLDLKTPCRYSVQIYDSMIEAWLARENSFVAPEKLREFSGDLAVNIFTKREKRGSERIPLIEAIQLASQRKIELQGWQLRNRSLLNRDADGNLKFAHRTIMEYLFVLKFIQDASSAPNQIWTDQMKKFWWEKLICMYDGLDSEGVPRGNSKDVQRLIDQALEFGDTCSFQFLPLQPLASFQTIKLNHADSAALADYRRLYAYQSPKTGGWIKRIPELFQRIIIPNPGYRGTSTNVVVDYVTGLMWQSDCLYAIPYSEAIERADNAKRQMIAGLDGWRIPSLREALSLLPACDDFRANRLHAHFGRWEDSIWTTDTLRTQSQGVACIYNDPLLACPQGHAYLRYVRTI